MRPAQCVSVRNTPLQWAPGWGARTCGPRKAGFSLLSTTPSPHQGQPLPCHPTARTALAFSTPYTDGLIQYNPLGVAFCSLEGHPCHHSARVFNLFIPIAVRYSTEWRHHYLPILLLTGIWVSTFSLELLLIVLVPIYIIGSWYMLPNCFYEGIEIYIPAHRILPMAYLTGD